MNAHLSKLQAHYSSSYSQLNISDTHANGWFVLMHKNGHWYELDADTLYQLSGDAETPTMRAYFNADIKLGYQAVTPKLIDNEDLFSGTEFEAVEVINPIIAQVDSIDVYELLLGAAFNTDGITIDDDEIKKLVSAALANTLINDDYAKVEALELVDLSAVAQKQSA